MDLTNSVVSYRRYLKRKNYSAHTIKNYLHSLRQFILWLNVPIEQVTSKEITDYIATLQRKRLRPETINCHLRRIRQFYSYLNQEHALSLVNPVKKGWFEYCFG